MKRAGRTDSSFSCRITMIILVFLVLWLPSTQGNNGLFTRPPQSGNKPVVSNGIVYYVNHLPAHCREPFVTKYPSGGRVEGKRALLARDNPHVIKGNIEIPSSACLWIEPGCVLRFGPGYGIIVNGTLVARGSEEDGGRITMTKNEGEDTGAPTGDWSYDARLSGGNTTQDGRLDLLYQGRWRAICTNYQNFTEIDVNVTCRHLGFLKGNFTYHSFSRNLTDYMLWELPACKGSENSLFQCPGASRIKTGAHICDGQQVVGFECEGLRPGLALDHWRGIQFLNSSYHDEYKGNIHSRETWSMLEYLDISYPGLDIFHGRTSEPGIYYPIAAISASPLVPVINNVTIKYAAYDAFNLTEITGPIHIANSSVHKSRGNGIFIQTAVGATLINTTQVTENWGDGIKFYVSNLTIHDFRQNFTFDSGFCYQPDLDRQVFPIFQHLDAVGPLGDRLRGRECTRKFATTFGKTVNLHFLLMESDPEATGSLTIYDGFGNGRKIDEFKVENGSFPQSVRTLTTTMRIRFQYKLPAGGCKKFPPCIRFLLRLSTTEGVEEEFRLVYSSVTDNVGYGVNVQDLRSKVFFNTSEVSRNQFGAGIRVYKGAGEIVINNTVLEGNSDAGINITYSGGYQVINNTQLIRNKGYGMITEYLQLNHTRMESMQRVEIVRGVFMFNELVGLRMGNYCRGGAVLVNESHFSYNLEEAIEYLSCNISTGVKGPTNFSIAFTEFTGNRRHAVLMRPLLNTVGIITNCTFTNHSLGVIRIDNSYDLLISKWYREFPVEYNIFQNKFEKNRGRYAVYLRLTDGSPKHRMYFKFNTLRNNYIQESFIYTNPRNRANAVAIISSGNIKFKRNILANRETSIRELATHLVDPSVTIDATENFWDLEIYRQSDFAVVHSAIFDQDDRYNLAKIDYYPALKTDRVYENHLTKEVPEYKWRFAREGNVIGGLLDNNNFQAQRGRTYYVDRDIYLFPGRIITLEREVTLEFAPSVGMVVHGCLKADGEHSQGTITFKKWTDPNLLPLENRTASVRLSNGSDLYEGRLEVLVGDEWGTVCRKGWTDHEASLVCQQLGLIYNPEQGVASVRVVAPPDTPILMAWVACDEADEDLTQCRAIHIPDIDCGHDEDVYLRCQEPTWAGITLPASARHRQSCETQLRAVSFQRAGLLDAETMSFTPALRIDYNFYQITAVSITNSLSDAIHINYIHPFAKVRLEYIQIHNNQGNGVVTRYPRLDISHSNITHSGKAGFMYDPFFSEYQALSVRSMIHDTRRSLMTETPLLSIGNGDMTFLLCPPGTNDQENEEYITEVRTDSSVYRIIVQVLDYFPVSEVEEVTVYDSPRGSMYAENTRRWRIPQDLVDFPIMSSTKTVTIRLRVKGLRSGRLAFAILSEIYITGPPRLQTLIFNTTLMHNDRGIQTKHYNSPTNKRLEIFHRFHLETISIDRTTIRNSKRQAMHMPSVTKFTDDYIPTYEDMTVPERVATIQYNISLGTFSDNAAGILAEHNHVDFANNVWQWFINHTTLEQTRRGGVEIEVPRVNDFQERRKHMVTVKECTFRNNMNFGFTVKGYYTDVKIENNVFDNNRCVLGLVSILGMEKNIRLVSNRMTNNVGRYMVDIDIRSHSEYSAPVSGIMLLNDIRNNRYEGLDPPGYGNSPKTYAVAFKGVQNMTANTNIFSNPDLGYELVAGITALVLGNPVNVKENYWGRTDYGGIMDRIFDFDDWNNYAIADFFPYLTRADFDSDLAGGEPVKPPLDTNRLGGRVLEDQILAYKPTPYIVERDLTIMPEATLIVSAGTELQFHPNVGILVLGRLIAQGLEYNRIRFRPLQPISTSGVTKRKKRSAAATVRLRGDGTLFKDAGFLELYNSSSKTWNMMCDSQFNEKSAEVVCRQLGKETVNVRVRFTHLYDHYIYGEPQYFLKEFWFESYFCRGDETDLRQCTTRYNYNMQRCIQAANYTFIVCGKRNLDAGQEYWGNIRFAARSYEEQPLESDIGRLESVLEYVDIEGAGMLHGEKVGAIQTTYVTPKFDHLNITRCAENGFDIIAPRGILEMNSLNVSNNLGFGFNFLILNGESSERVSSFLQLGPSTIPYHVYGLVEICRMEKEITLDTRMILYYKYGPTVRDCVKIIRTSNPRNRIGLRFLQINMFHEDFSRNVVEIFDGQEINDRSLLAELMANTSGGDLGRLYKSSGNTLTVHLHASVSHGTYGFIAEVVHLPLTGLTYPDSNYRHTISQSISSRNQDGAIQYKNVGEVNPSFYMDKCWLEDNGVAILNLTSPPTIDISLQGTLLFRFASNFVSRNKGGMYLSVNTKTIATALKGNITNNIFSFGTNGEALNITGHYFQRLYIFQNYIFNHTAGDWRDVVHIRDVVVNYTYNYLDNNTGHNILAAYDNNIQQEQQEFTRSGFFRNNATALLESTIKIGRGRPLFLNNYIINEDNDFELETYPKVDQNNKAINITKNWWGSGLSSYINGKVWDKLDDPLMVPAEFWEPQFNNDSVVDRNCPPGWKEKDDRCYRFMGGALPYYHAREFCRTMGAFLGEARGKEGFYHYLLTVMRNNNNPKDRVWVMSEVGSSRCTAFEYSNIEYEQDCWNILYPFICEKDPYLTRSESMFLGMAIGLGAGIGGVIILVVIIFGILWCVKSKRREKERFERTASLRSSVRSSMRMSKSTLTMLSEGHSRRRLNEIDMNSEASSGVTKGSRGTEGLNGSMGSLNQAYRNGRPATIDRSLGDRRGMERNRWRDRDEDRQYDVDREPNWRRDRRRGDDDPESYEGSRGRDESRGMEDSESEIDKKELDDSEADDSFESDEEEPEASGEPQPENHQYQNHFTGVPLPGMGPDSLRHARSRDNVYENQDAENGPAKSRSLSSFNQPATPDEPPVRNLFLPRRSELPSPPPTPHSYRNSPTFGRPNPPQGATARPPVGPKPATRSAHRHPSVEYLQQSPVPSEGSVRSGSSRPSPLPRKNLGGSEGSSPRETPTPYGASNYPDYENQAAPLPPKMTMDREEFVPRSKNTSLDESYDYKPQTPYMSPSQRLPNLPRYSPPLPLERPPSYEEQDQYPEYQFPDYGSHYPPDSYMPSQEPPDQDVQYLPRAQPQRPPHFHSSREHLGGSRDRRGGSRDRLGGSRDQLDGSRDRLGGSRDQLDGSRDRLGGSRGNVSGSRDHLNHPYRPAAYSPNVLYLNSNSGDNSERPEHLETEI